MNIVPYSAALRGPYAEFAGAHPAALFFHSPAYLEFLCELLGAANHSLLALDAAGKVLGALPLLGMQGAAGLVLNSLPFYGSHGGTLADEHAVAAALLQAYSVLAAAPQCAGATLVENLRDRWDYTALKPSYTDERIGQITPIAHAGEHAARLMESFHFKTRNMVRKSQRGGFEVRVDNDALDILEAMHRENLAALGGIAKPPRFFSLIRKHFTPGRDYRLSFAYKDGRVAACLLLFYFGSTVEYFVPATQVEYREMQPLSLLIFEAMTDASQRGYRWWNWGGTWKTQDGVYHFKKRWGTEDHPYRYHTVLNRADILDWPREKILAEYPFFYVVPFSALPVKETAA